MKKIARLLSFTVVLASLLTVSRIGLATAADSSPVAGTGNGIKISPVRSELNVNPGSTQSVTLVVQNVTGSTASFQAIVNDFIVNPGNETGQPNLLLDASKFAPSHSLKRFVAPVQNLTLAPGQSTNVKVNITVPANAAGGGYYGAVRFAPSSNSASNKNVTLSASVGSLILIKVPGDIKDDLSITSFDVRGAANAGSARTLFTNNKSLYSTVRFENKGNIQEQPFGKIVVRKGSKTLQTTEINNTDPRGNVLPNSVRRFSIQLDKIGSFGKYTVEGNFGYGPNGQLLSAKSTFYVVPVALLVLAAIVIVLIVLAAILLPRALKRYNKRVVRRAGRR